jgi:hypothetical protein
MKTVLAKNHFKTILLAALLPLLSCSASADAADSISPREQMGKTSTEVPRQIKDVGITENLGKKLEAGFAKAQK